MHGVRPGAIPSDANLSRRTAIETLQAQVFFYHDLAVKAGGLKAGGADGAGDLQGESPEPLPSAPANVSINVAEKALGMFKSVWA